MIRKKSNIHVPFVHEHHGIRSDAKLTRTKKSVSARRNQEHRAYSPDQGLRMNRREKEARGRSSFSREEVPYPLVIFSKSLIDVSTGSLRQREFGRHFYLPSDLFFLSVSRISLAGHSAGEKEVTFPSVASEGGGAFELAAGFRVAP